MSQLWMGLNASAVGHEIQKTPKFLEPLGIGKTLLEQKCLMGIYFQSKQSIIVETTWGLCHFYARENDFIASVFLACICCYWQLVDFCVRFQQDGHHRMWIPILHNNSHPVMSAHDWCTKFCQSDKVMLQLWMKWECRASWLEVLILCYPAGAQKWSMSWGAGYTTDLHNFAFLGKNPDIGTASDWVWFNVPHGPLKQIESFVAAQKAVRKGKRAVRITPWASKDWAS